MSTFESNYTSTNSYVKKIEKNVKSTESGIKNNQIKNIFATSSDMKQQSDTIKKEYHVSGDATTKRILEEWKECAELRKNVLTESVDIEKEAKIIEERFRQLSGLK